MGVDKEGVLVKKHIFLEFSLMLLVLIIISNSLAGFFGIPIYYLFYNFIFGLVLSTAVPVFYIVKHKESLASVGVKPLKARQFIVLVAFIAFSIGGQLSHIDVNKLRVDLIPICIIPMIMTTFFEEFLFRGFMQTRFEKQYGWLPAVLLSGLMFSVYHLGYSGLRDTGSLLLLFAVGIGFALSYKLSGNNLIVSYFVNLPNSILTYMLKSSQFPHFDGSTPVVAAITVILIPIVIILVKRKAELYLSD